MDLYFEPTKGRPFAIEVGYFDTVSEIKEKIQKDQGIPASKQTLIFNGQVLSDDFNVHFSDILDCSRIQLAVAPDHPEIINNNNNLLKIKTEDSSSSSRKVQVQLLLKMPTSKLGVAVEMDVNESVKRLKERIHEMDGVPVNRLVLHANGRELQDHRSLQDYELSERSEVEINVRPAAPSTSSSTGSGGGNANGSSKKLRVMVVTKCGTRKFPVEVNGSESVGELRKELQRLKQRLHFHLPPEGYFFIYKQNVMDEDRSFRWHHVCQGDTIEIFNGSVTGGS